jgi:hypothetical protein
MLTLGVVNLPGSQIRDNFSDPAVIRASNQPDCESGWTQTLAIVICWNFCVPILKRTFTQEWR